MTVGTHKAAQRDNDCVKVAKLQLGPGASVRDILIRAHALVMEYRESGDA